MDRRAWWATVYGVARVRQYPVTASACARAHTHTHSQILGKRCLNDHLNQPFNLTDGELSSGEVIQLAQSHQ